MYIRNGWLVLSFGLSFYAGRFLLIVFCLLESDKMKSMVARLTSTSCTHRIYDTFFSYFLQFLKTAIHLFLECPVSKAIWISTSTWLRHDSLHPQTWQHANSVPDAWLASVTASSPEKQQAVKTMLMLVSWSIWKERCSRVFLNKRMTVQQIMQLIQDEARAWAFVGAKKLRKLLSWDPP